MAYRGQNTTQNKYSKDEMFEERVIALEREVKKLQSQNEMLQNDLQKAATVASKAKEELEIERQQAVLREKEIIETVAALLEDIDQEKEIDCEFLKEIPEFSRFGVAIESLEKKINQRGFESPVADLLRGQRSAGRRAGNL